MPRMTVYHMCDFTDAARFVTLDQKIIKETAFTLLENSGYVKAAEIDDADDLEHAYGLTNNNSQANTHWRTYPGVRSTDMSFRSSAVGDLIVNEDAKEGYVVSGVGFTKIADCYS